MRRIFSIILLLGIKASVFSQESMEWSFKYSFSIDKSNDFDSLEVLKSEPFDLSANISSSGSLKLNDSTEIYTLSINYGCIGCGYPSRYIPPNLFLKVYTHDVLDSPYFILIPIVSDDLIELRQMGFTINIDLGMINLFEFNPLIHTNNREGIFQGIRVLKDSSIEKYFGGKYAFPTMQKMTTIKAYNKT
jgi:hypothetical protein